MRPQVHDDAASMAVEENGRKEGSISEAVSESSGQLDRTRPSDDDRAAKTSEDEEDEDEEESEPTLKYTKLTGSLGPTYRGRDSTSAVLVSGDKMITGTHNGNIHVLSLPSLQILRTYHAHSASVTAISLSPFSASLQSHHSQPVADPRSESPAASIKRTQRSAAEGSPRTAPKPRPSTIESSTYIATSSLDGHVCVSSLTNPEDVTLRNYARPVQAVALSPEFRRNRTYLSGGLAGSLVLTIGGQAGVSSNANTNSAAAAASGWLGSMGLGQNTGKDTVLHSGEGSISTIKWSLSGRYVAWVNEQGIKIMRTNLYLDSTESESAWKRIGHIDKPSRSAWKDMAGVWKARAQWIDESCLESADTAFQKLSQVRSQNPKYAASERSSSVTPTATPQKLTTRIVKRIEKLLVGWGDTVWTIHIISGERGNPIGKPTIVHQLRFSDGVVCGLSQYTPDLLLALIYRTRDDNDILISSPNANGNRTQKGIKRRQNGLPPEIRLIDLNSDGKDELEADSLPVTQYQYLSMADYHLSTTFFHPQPVSQDRNRSNVGLASLGDGIFDASKNATTRLFSSSASALSTSSSGGDRSGTLSPGRSKPSTLKSFHSTPTSYATKVLNPAFSKPGLKVFLHSPHDVWLAIKRDLSDHLSWLIEHEKKYKEAWELLDAHPEISLSVPQQGHQEESSQPSTPTHVAPTPSGQTLADFFAPSSASASETSNTSTAYIASAAREKRCIADLWLSQLTSANDYATAGQVATKILDTPQQWEYWIRRFASQDQHSTIAFSVPAHFPRLSQDVYGLLLKHYIEHDEMRTLNDLVRKWDTGLYSAEAVATALEVKLEDGVIPTATEDWTLVQTMLAALYSSSNRPAEALWCYVRAGEADAALALVQECKLHDAAARDIWAFCRLRISDELLDAPSTTLDTLEQLSSEPVAFLAEGTSLNQLPTSHVIDSLQPHAPASDPFLFFYIRALWNGVTLSSPPPEDKPNLAFTTTKRRTRPRFAPLVATNTTRALLAPHSDLVIDLFADYSRSLLSSLIKSSDTHAASTPGESSEAGIPYSFDHALATCRRHNYVPELVHLLAATGAHRDALRLITTQAQDPRDAIAFCRDVGDPGLWADLVDFALDAPRPRPAFVRALLEASVGVAEDSEEDPGERGGVDAASLIERIPPGLEIPGLKVALLRVLREAEVARSISLGAARVLRGEVVARMSRANDVRARGMAVGGKPLCAVCDSPIPTSSPAQDDDEVKDALIVIPCTSLSSATATPTQPQAHLVHLSCVLTSLPSTATSSPDEAASRDHQSRIDDVRSRLDILADEPSETGSTRGGKRGRVKSKMEKTQILRPLLQSLSRSLSRGLAPRTVGTGTGRSAGEKEEERDCIVCAILTSKATTQHDGSRVSE